MRFAEGSAQCLKELARELVDAQMDVIVTPAVPATIAVRQGDRHDPDRCCTRAIRSVPA